MNRLFILGTFFTLGIVLILIFRATPPKAKKDTHPNNQQVFIIDTDALSAVLEPFSSSETESKSEHKSHKPAVVIKPTTRMPVITTEIGNMPPERAPPDPNENLALGEAHPGPGEVVASEKPPSAPEEPIQSFSDISTVLLNLQEPLEEPLLSADSVQLCLPEGIDNITSLSQEQVNSFYACKEAQYQTRRGHIHAYCEALKESNFTSRLKKLSKVNEHEIRYSAEHGFLISNACKCASSTWAKLILKLQSEKTQKKYIKRIHVSDQELWPLPENQSYSEAFEGVVSLTMSRHPFSRVASTYFDKVLKMGWFKKLLYRLEDPAELDKDQVLLFKTEHLETILNTSKVLFKLKDEENGYEKNITYIPSPESFVKLLGKGLINTDCHMRGQTDQIAFCSSNFTIYGQVEDMPEDKAYFLLKTGLTDKLSEKIHGNKRSEGLTDKDFWSQVSAESLLVAYDRYFWDFEVLGYSPVEFLVRNGMEDTAQRIKNRIAEIRLAKIEEPGPAVS